MQSALECSFPIGPVFLLIEKKKVQGASTLYECLHRNLQKEVKLGPMVAAVHRQGVDASILHCAGTTLSMVHGIFMLLYVIMVYAHSPQAWDNELASQVHQTRVLTIHIMS